VYQPDGMQVVSRKRKDVRCGRSLSFERLPSHIGPSVVPDLQDIPTSCGADLTCAFFAPPS
jgi:hypothetical protein